MNTKKLHGRISLAQWCEDHDLLQMLLEFDVEKNDVTPDQISYGSTKSVFWTCRLGHTWNSTANNRTNQRTGCPYCGNKKVLRGFNDLTTTHPDIAREWHPTKNEGKLASEYVSQSNFLAWWQCEQGHEYKAVIASRIKDYNGCPICSNKQLLSGYNDLETRYPELATEWNYERNGELKPCQVGFGTHKKVWWKCREGHEWVATIVSRAANGNGCPFCAGQRVIPGVSDLETKNPALAAEWDYIANAPITPAEVAPYTNKAYGWICDRGHTYKATPSDRSGGKGCPFCAGRKVWVGFNDLASQNPTLSREWHPTRNLPLLPSDVTCGSDKKVWWVCARQHEWQAAISSRNHGNGCPECAKGLQSSLPEKTIFYYVRKQWPDAQGNVKFPWLNKQELDIYIPTLSVGIEYDGDFWHRAPEKDTAKAPLCFDHGVRLIRIREPECPPYEAKYSYHIPVRAGQANIQYMEDVVRRVFDYINATFQTNIVPDIDIQAHYPLIIQDCVTIERENSFVFTHPHLLSEWNGVKNAPLQPENFARGSQKKVWWKCEMGHEWQAAISTRTRGSQCPYCTGRYVLTGFNDFATVHPELIDEWDHEKNLPLLPSQVLHSSNRKVWWRCKRGHSWQTMIASRLIGNNCPICSNQKILAGYNDLATTHPDLVKEWDFEKNDTLLPSAVCSGTEKNAWWICPEGHSYYANIRTRAKLGTGCRICYRSTKKVNNRKKDKSP